MIAINDFFMPIPVSIIGALMKSLTYDWSPFSMHTNLNWLYAAQLTLI